MGALIEKYASAFSAPGGAPCAGIIIALGTEPVGDQPVGTADGAHFAAFNDFLHFSVYAVGALVEHDGENLVALCGIFVELTNSFGINAGGLFAHGVMSL